MRRNDYQCRSDPSTQSASDGASQFIGLTGMMEGKREDLLFKRTRAIIADFWQVGRSDRKKGCRFGCNDSKELESD